MVHITSD